MIRRKQFIQLSQEGENARLEYKTCTEHISDSLYETVCSFLNHSGGRILVGVKDSGEIVGNLCVHTDYSSGYACFFHVFKDRVVTKNPTRLLPEIPEGELTLQQLNNYTKNPLLVRVFHELAWVEDMGSGTRNILRYAPLYYPNYKVEIDSGSQFIFSITYLEMSQEKEMDDDLNISLKDNSLVNKKTIVKRHKRQQGIIGLIKQNPNITMEEMAEKLDVNERTIKRDLEDLKNVVVHIGPTKSGYWTIINNRS